MIYSKSIYCNKKEQEKPRPARWYDTKTKGIVKLQKFSWVKIPDIAFELSFASAHKPLHDGWDNEVMKSKLKYNQYVFPFGTMSRENDNAMYWYNCAITYLLVYNENHIEKCTFEALISKLDDDEPIPAHWLEHVNIARKKMLEAKAKFKTCREREKENFGLIPKSKIPRKIQKDLIAIQRLKLYLEFAPHNKILISGFVEKFLSDSFTYLMKNHVLESDEVGCLNEKDYMLQLDVLSAFIAERVLFVKHQQLDDGVISSSFAVDNSVAMHYNTGILSREFGSIKHLVSLARKLKKYCDMPDTSKWFGEDIIRS